MSQHQEGGRKYSFVLDTDISAMPSLGGLSVIHIGGLFVLWCVSFTTGAFIGGLSAVGILKFLACLGVATAGTVLSFVLVGVTPSYCTMKDYMDQRRVEKNKPTVRLHDSFSGGDE